MFNPMNSSDIVGAQPALFLTRTRNGIIWCSGAYTEQSPFRAPIVWVSIIVANRDEEIGQRISLMSLN
jgi:hypothetical protein